MIRNFWATASEIMFFWEMAVMSGHGCGLYALMRRSGEMEDREDTVVGNSGVRLSGGQAARLALARMLAMESR